MAYPDPEHQYYSLLVCINSNAWASQVKTGFKRASHRLGIPNIENKVKIASVAFDSNIEHIKSDLYDLDRTCKGHNPLLVFDSKEDPTINALIAKILKFTVPQADICMSFCEENKRLSEEKYKYSFVDYVIHDPFHGAYAKEHLINIVCYGKRWTPQTRVST